MKRIGLVLMAVVSVSGMSHAEGKQGETKVIQEADKTVYRKRATVDFTDVAVEGELSKPEGSYSITKKRTTFKSLIKVRTNFNPELQKSVDHL